MRSLHCRAENLEYKFDVLGLEMSRQNALVATRLSLLNDHKGSSRVTPMSDLSNACDSPSPLLDNCEAIHDCDQQATVPGSCSKLHVGLKPSQSKLFNAEQIVLSSDQHPSMGRMSAAGVTGIRRLDTTEGSEIDGEYQAQHWDESEHDVPPDPHPVTRSPFESIIIVKDTFVGPFILNIVRSNSWQMVNVIFHPSKLILRGVELSYSLYLDRRGFPVIRDGELHTYCVIPENDLETLVKGEVQTLRKALQGKQICVSDRAACCSTTPLHVS